MQGEHAFAFVNIKLPELQLPASLALTCRCSWRENVRWSRKISCDQWPAPAALAERNSPSEEAFLFCRIWHFPLSIIWVGLTASMFICAWQSFTSSAATTFVFYNICQLYNTTDLSAFTIRLRETIEKDACQPNGPKRVCKKSKVSAITQPWSEILIRHREKWSETLKGSTCLSRSRGVRVSPAPPLPTSTHFGSNGMEELEEDNRERAGACSRDQTDTWKPLVLRIPTHCTKCNVTKVSQVHTSPKLSPTS